MSGLQGGRQRGSSGTTNGVVSEEEESYGSGLTASRLARDSREYV